MEENQHGVIRVPPSSGKQHGIAHLITDNCQHFFPDHLGSVISSIKTIKLINGIQNVDCGGGSATNQEQASAAA
jgi:hypothetical protein